MLSGLLKRKRNLEQGLEISRQTDKSYILREGGDILLKRELICAAFPQRRSTGKIETLGYFGMLYPGQQALVICRNPLTLPEEMPKLRLNEFMQVSFSIHPSKVWAVDLRSEEGNLPKRTYEDPKSSDFLNPRTLDVSEAYNKPSWWLMGSEFYRAFLSATPLTELVEEFKEVRAGWPEN